MAARAWPAMAAIFSPEVTMPDGFSCTCTMTMTWHPIRPEAGARADLLREAALLLSALNQMEGVHEAETGGAESRRLERLEAKLDLALHLLARVLEPGPAAEALAVPLSPDGAEWPDAAPPASGAGLVLELRPSDRLALTLKLPAVALEPLPGRARVRFENLPEELGDAWYQFVFRRHRQAIRTRSG